MRTYHVSFLPGATHDSSEFEWGVTVECQYVYSQTARKNNVKSVDRTKLGFVRNFITQTIFKCSVSQLNIWQPLRILKLCTFLYNSYLVTQSRSKDKYKNILYVVITQTTSIFVVNKTFVPLLATKTLFKGNVTVVLFKVSVYNFLTGMLSL